MPGIISQAAGSLQSHPSPFQNVPLDFNNLVGILHPLGHSQCSRAAKTVTNYVSPWEGRHNQMPNPGSSIAQCVQFAEEEPGREIKQLTQVHKANNGQD